MVNAIYGFLLVFFKILKEFKPDFVAACFDFPAPTFRHKMFKDYKITRPKAPEELYSQIPKVKKVLKTFNIPVFEKKGFEADDIIGAISRLAPRKQVMPKLETIILSGDLDVLQLVNKNTMAYILRRGLKDIALYDEKAVEKKYQGLNPSQLVDFKSLRGDTSDNIPGVPGIGEKTAIKLIREFGSIEKLYQEIQNLKSEIRDSLKDKLLEHRDHAFLSKMLSKIKCNIPLEFNLQKCYWQRFNLKKTIKTLKNYEFHSLISRLPELRKTSFQTRYTSK